MLETMLLLIDNFDSFTFNLVHAFFHCGYQAKVVRNTISIAECLSLQPWAVVLGPGPGTPQEAGVTLPLLKWLEENKIPTLGVCLGHQALALHFGGEIKRAEHPTHGKVTSIYHDQKAIFHGVSSPFAATRYHSLVVEKRTLPSCLKVTAATSCGEIMALEHCELPLFGVQFHPESIMTKEGIAILSNFLLIARDSCKN